MGVPKLFRWLSERYPLCVEPILNTTCRPNPKNQSRIEGTPSDYELPAVREVFDNLYLDLNGIIHNCSHPSDTATDNTLTTEQIAANIFRYVSKIVAIIRPRKFLYIAVDGVAPRAKMNQQRSRRFRSAADAAKSREALARAGLKAPTGVFDSNCISPGTEFMEELNSFLKYFISQKQSEDTIWRNMTVLYSGHDVPGEGEHKIMDFIRSQRAEPHHDPTTTHCFYGLDADLLLLGLATHERYISVLREETLSREALTTTKRAIIPERFQFVHIGVLREYLELEFTPYFVNFDFDIDRLVDDLLLLMSLVGDDFLPGIPAMGIAEHGLEHIFCIYGRAVASLDGYITDGPVINRDRLLRLLGVFGSSMVVDNEFDYNSISDKTFSKEAIEIANSDSKMDLSSTSSSLDYVPRTIPLDILKMADSPLNKDINIEIKDKELNNNEDEDKEINKDKEINNDKDNNNEDKDKDKDKDKGNNTSETKKLVIEITKSKDKDNNKITNHLKQVQNAKALKNKAIREKYYSAKFGKENSLERNPDFIDELCRHYLDGICWVLHYYLGGCPSWTWYYPYHYAPYIQELAAAATAGWEPPEFAEGAPVLPFQQLMCVLPAASAALVPSTYRALLTSADSPIAEFYPREFETDLNGKRNDWESVVLIPFIDTAAVFAAMAAAEAAAPLTKAEVARNRNKIEYLYEHTRVTAGSKVVTSPLPGVLPKRFLLESKVTEVRDKAALHRVLGKKWAAKPLPKGVCNDATSCCGAAALSGATDGKGFPDLGTIGGYDVEFSCRSVKININPSRNRSAILRFDDPLEDAESGTLLRTPANELFGKPILFGWPYFWEGVVSDLLFEPGASNPEDYGRWADEEEAAKSMAIESCGIELNSVSAILAVAPLASVVLDPTTGTVAERVYDRDCDPLSVPYNLFDPSFALPPLEEEEVSGVTVRRDRRYRNADSDDYKFYYTMDKVLMCKVVASGDDNGYSGEDPSKLWTLNVVKEIPTGYSLRSIRKDDEKPADGSMWLGLRDIARRLKCSERTLYKLTGHTRCDKNVISFMLHSKLNWTVVSGWCRTNHKLGYLEFAKGVADYLLYYKQVFPSLFNLVDTEKNPTTSHIVPGNPKASNEVIKNFNAWLSTLPFIKGDYAKVPFRTDALSNDAVTSIQLENEKNLRERQRAAAANQPLQQPRTLRVARNDPKLVHSLPILAVKVSNFNNKLLYAHSLGLGTRVLNICNDGIVPIGATGTIIRVKYPVDIERTKALGTGNPVCSEVVYDVLFDEPFCSGTTLGGKCKDFCGYSRNDSQIVPLKLLRTMGSAPVSIPKSSIPRQVIPPSSSVSSSSTSSSESGFPMPGEVPHTNVEIETEKISIEKKKVEERKEEEKEEEKKEEKKRTLTIVKKQKTTATQQKNELTIVRKNTQQEKEQEKPQNTDIGKPDDVKPDETSKKTKLTIIRKKTSKEQKSSDKKVEVTSKQQQQQQPTEAEKQKDVTEKVTIESPPQQQQQQQQQQKQVPPPSIPATTTTAAATTATTTTTTTVKMTTVETPKNFGLLFKKQQEQQLLQLQQLQKLQAQRRGSINVNNLHKSFELPKPSEPETACQQTKSVKNQENQENQN